MTDTQTSSAGRNPRSRAPLTRGATIALWAPVVLLAAGGIAGLTVPSVTAAGNDAVAVILATVITLLYGGMGALLIAHQRANVVGWLVWLIGLAIGVLMAANTYAVWSATALATPPPGAVLAGWFNQWAFNPILATAIVLLPLLFPTGRAPSARWRPAVMLVLVWIAIVGLPSMLEPGTLGPTSIQNPTAWTGDPALLDVLGAVNTVAGPPAFMLVVLSAVVRYRRGTTIERAQLRWFGAIATLAVVGITIATLAPDPVSIIGFFGALVAVALFPVAIAIAILRYRLYAIDRLISRSISWAVISVCLAGAFAGVVLVLQAALSGVTQGETLAVAASTLVAFALFQPLRRRVQGAVDHRFDRARYDGKRLVDGFAEGLRDEVNLDEIQSGMLATVGAAIRPEHGAVWLRVDGA